MRPIETTGKVFFAVLSALSSGMSSSQLRLFHGLVPAVAGLDEAGERLDRAATADWVRPKQRTRAAAELASIKALIIQCSHRIQAQAAELGYPLDHALESYRETEASLTTLASMKEALAHISDVDWDTWLSNPYDDELGNAAA